LYVHHQKYIITCCIENQAYILIKHRRIPYFHDHAFNALPLANQLKICTEICAAQGSDYTSWAQPWVFADDEEMTGLAWVMQSIQSMKGQDRKRSKKKELIGSCELVNALEYMDLLPDFPEVICEWCGCETNVTHHGSGHHFMDRQNNMTGHSADNIKPVDFVCNRCRSGLPVAAFYRLCYRVLINKGCKVELSLPLKQMAIEAEEIAAKAATEATEAAEARTMEARTPAGREATAVRRAQKVLTAKDTAFV
jgi:hypothetical protein